MIQSSISRLVNNNKKGIIQIVMINGDGSAVVYSSIHSSLRRYIITVLLGVQNHLKSWVSQFKQARDFVYRRDHVGKITCIDLLRLGRIIALRTFIHA